MRIKRQLLLGDCLERLSDVPDGSVDMVLADPPYGITACKWDSVIPLEPMWEQLKRITKPNSAIVLMASQPFTSALVMSNVKMFKYCWVWEKAQGVNFLQAKYRPMRVHEDVCIFSNKSAVYNPQMSVGVPYISGTGYSGEVTNRVKKKQTKNQGTRYPRTIIRFNSETGLHPTQKPVALMEYLIKTCTNKGDTVLDFCMGSGTTGVAAKALRRSFIGIELDRKYFRIAKQRIKDD